MARALEVISVMVVMLPLACIAADEFEVEHAPSPADSPPNEFLSARKLKGKDVGGADLNDIILGGAGAMLAIMICCGVAVCWRHHKEAQLDPYTETLWRCKHDAPIAVRAGSNPNSRKTNHLIMPGAVLRVQDEVTAKDGSKHLKLADHTGYLPETVPEVGLVMELIPVTSSDEACKGFSGSAKKWEFFHKWGWAKYDPTISKLISSAQAKGVAAVDSPPEQSVRTVIDLVSMQQVNMVTGHRRPIRLHRQADNEQAANSAV